MRTRIFTLFLVFAGFLQAYALSVESSFDPLSSTMGRSVNYVVTIQGASDVSDFDGQVPEVEGLRISSSASRSVQRSYSIINGRASSSYTVSLSFSVQPEREGSFTVPAWQITMGGEEYRVPPARLEITPPGEEQRNAVSLSIQLPDTLYVGQSSKAMLELALREDVRVADIAAPERHGDGFLHSDFDPDHVERSRIRRNGQIYEVFRWPVLLTPIKDGELTLDYSMEIAAVLPKSGNRRSRSIFDDQFFARPERLTVNSEEKHIQIQPLPEEGKPEHFTGAIGSFEASAEVDHTSTQVGEPVTVSLSLSGTGNFEQMQAPEVLADEAWRVYPPKTEFEAQDDLGYEGIRRYDYLLVPLNEDLKTLPPLAVNYFDPEAKSYEELPVSLPEITVAPAAAGSVRVSGGGLVTEPSGERARLLPIALTSGDFQERLVPALRTPAFWSAQAVPLLAFAGLIFWKRQKTRGNAGQRERKAAREEALRELRTAEHASEDTASFYTHAETALQAAALVAGQPSRGRESVLAATQERGLETEKLTKLYEHSDAVRFGGLSVAATEVETDRKTLVTFVKKLTSRA